MTKVQNAQPLGQYKRTSIDAAKEQADFLLLQVSPYVIRWANGQTETVNKRKLNKLQKEFSWHTDF